MRCVCRRPQLLSDTDQATVPDFCSLPAPLSLSLSPVGGGRTGGSAAKEQADYNLVYKSVPTVTDEHSETKSKHNGKEKETQNTSFFTPTIQPETIPSALKTTPRESSDVKEKYSYANYGKKQ